MPIADPLGYTEPEGTARTRRDPNLESTFRALAQKWRDETAHLSSIQAKSTNRWYQMIIGLGQPALPLLLDELQRDPDHWFWALEAISRETPIATYDDFDEAVGRWIEWGRARALI